MEVVIKRAGLDYGREDVMRVVRDRAVNHWSSSVKVINGAIARVGEIEGSWVAELMDSNGLQVVYTSPTEAALALEKGVVNMVVGDFWMNAVRANEGRSTGEGLMVPEGVLESVRARIKEIDKQGWEGFVGGMSLEDADGWIGSPISTHRPARYQRIFRDVVLPAVDGRWPEVILDAGASGGGGAMVAEECFDRSLKRYLAVDLIPPEERTVRTLVASVRLEEIESGDVKTQMEKVMHHPRVYEPIRADLMDMRAEVPSEVVDVVVANFSLYQTEEPGKAFDELGRVLTCGGLCVVTDFIRGNGGLWVDPRGEVVKPSTWAWVKTRRANLEGPFECYRWGDNDFGGGEMMGGLGEVTVAWERENGLGTERVLLGVGQFGAMA